MISVIGEGSYGQVWQARSTLGTMRAVKVVWRAKFDSERPYEREFSGIKRFEPVSRSHEGLVDILQVGRNDQAGFFYYVMELADNADTGTSEAASYTPRTLRSEIDAHGRIPAGECVNLFLTLAAALGHMHRLGLIHRDVKPSNIVIVNGVAKLADIGLVAEMSESRSFVGTEGYIPPEGPNSAQADIYSLGKALYEASTGQDRMRFPTLPATGPDGLAGISGMMDLNAVAMRACMPEPEQRYQSGAEMLADLATIQSGRSVREVHRSADRLRFARRVGLAAAVVALIAAGVGAVAMSQAKAERDSRQRAEALLRRAEKAEAESSERFYGQSVALARAECLSSQTGHRFRALDSLRDAARLRPGDAGLRGQAIGVLAIPDMRETRRWRGYSAADGAPLRQAFAPGLERYASILPDGGIVLRNTSGQGGETRLPPQSPAPDWLDFSSDGRYLLAMTLHSKGDYVIWDTQTSTETLRIPGDISWLTYGMVRFRKEKKEVAMLQGAAVLVMPLDGSAPRTIPLPSKKDCLTMESAGRVLAGSRTNGRVYLVNLETNRVEYTIPDQKVSFSFGLSPDARTGVVTAGGKCFLHDLTGNNHDAVPLPGSQGQITSSDFDPAGELLITNSWDGTARMFGIDDREQLSTSTTAMASALSFHPDGRRVGFLERSQYNLVEAEWAGRAACRTFRMPVNGVENTAYFAAGGQLILSGGGAGLQVNDAHTLKPLVTLPSAIVRGSVMKTKEGPLYLATATGLFRRRVQQSAMGQFVFGSAEQLLPGDSWGVFSSADGAVVVAMAGWKIFVNRAGGDFQFLIPAPDQFRVMSVSPDGRWLATHGTQLLVFDLDGGKEPMPVLTLPGSGTSLVAFSSDSTHLVVSSVNGIRSYSLPGGKVLWECTEGTGGTNAVCSPDGRLIAAQISPFAFYLMRPADGSIIARVENPHGGHIGDLAFSPDSRQLLITETNNIARVWDLPHVRTQLASLQLDWEDPPFPPPTLVEPATATCPDAGSGNLIEKEKARKSSDEPSEQKQP